MENKSVQVEAVTVWCIKHYVASCSHHVKMRGLLSAFLSIARQTLFRVPRQQDIILYLLKIIQGELLG